jgi:hypothetical protein
VRCAAFTLSAGLSKGIVAPLWGHLPVGSPPCGVTSLWERRPRRDAASNSRLCLFKRPIAARARLPREHASHHGQMPAPNCGRSTLPITTRCKPQVVGAPPSARCGLKQPTLLIQSPHRREGAAPTRARLPSRPDAGPELWEERASLQAQVQAPSCGSAALGAMRPRTADFAYSVAPSPRGRGSHRSTLPITPMGKPKVVGGARFTLRPWASPQLWERRPRRDWACPKSSTPFKRPIAARARLPQGWAILLHAEKVSLP